MTDRAVILGASSGVGRALAVELSRRGFDLVLAARDERDLTSLAADIEARQRTRAHVCVVDLDSPAFAAREFREVCCERLGGVEAVFLTAGMVDDRDVGPAEPEVTARLIRVNYSRIVQLVSEFARLFELRGSGTLVTFSSIAAAGPRRRNVTYSSAKAAVEVYCRGLRHYFRDSQVVVQTYALGYVDTAMTFGKKLLFPIASPAGIARHVADNLHRDRGRVYLPRFWALVVLVLRHTPWFLYKRLSF